MQEQTAALIKIAQRLPHGEVLDYDHIELPFELVKIALKLWENFYPPELLENLANSDPDTLDAWAIALSQTLSQQLSLLDTWDEFGEKAPGPNVGQYNLTDVLPKISPADEIELYLSIAETKCAIAIPSPVVLEWKAIDNPG